MFIFKNLIQTQSQKGQKFKNPAAEQRSSPQGCTVRPETSAGQSSLRARGEQGCLAPSVHCGPLLVVFGVGYTHNQRVPSGAHSETTASSCQVDNLPTSRKHLTFICC